MKQIQLSIISDGYGKMTDKQELEPARSLAVALTIKDPKSNGLQVNNNKLNDHIEKLLV